MNVVTDKIPGKTPKVSVCVVTYNQRKYIRQCLQSIVDQETDFDFEIIVGDDCSTDGTREIVREFSERYPNKFRLFLHEENIGALPNFKFIHEQAWGKYIAHMDGDDYALPGKLQIQAKFLDENKKCNIAFHRMIVADGESCSPFSPPAKSIMQHKFYRRNIIELVAIGANSSKMYRASVREEKLPDFDVVDYTVNVIQIGDGYAAYCSDVPLGVYRKGIGISGSFSVINSVFNALNYFKKAYPECRSEINASAWGWLASNIKNKRPLKREFLHLGLSTFTITGLVKFFANRKLKKDLGK